MHSYATRYRIVVGFVLGLLLLGGYPYFKLGEVKSRIWNSHWVGSAIASFPNGSNTYRLDFRGLGILWYDPNCFSTPDRHVECAAEVSTFGTTVFVRTERSDPEAIAEVMINGTTYDNFLNGEKSRWDQRQLEMYHGLTSAGFKLLIDYPDVTVRGNNLLQQARARFAE